MLLHRSVVNLKRQRSRLLQSYAINIANFLFLGIVFLGLRIPVRASWRLIAVQN